MRRVGCFDHEAHLVAVAAVQAVLPLPYKEASAEAVNASPMRAVITRNASGVV
jgi:hypothetical protein